MARHQIIVLMTGKKGRDVRRLVEGERPQAVDPTISISCSEFISIFFHAIVQPQVGEIGGPVRHRFAQGGAHEGHDRFVSHAGISSHKYHCENLLRSPTRTLDVSVLPSRKISSGTVLPIAIRLTRLIRWASSSTWCR